MIVIDVRRGGLGGAPSPLVGVVIDEPADRPQLRTDRFVRLQAEPMSGTSSSGGAVCGCFLNGGSTGRPSPSDTAGRASTNCDLSCSASRRVVGTDTASAIALWSPAFLSASLLEMDSRRRTCSLAAPAGSNCPGGERDERFRQAESGAAQEWVNSGNWLVLVEQKPYSAEDFD